MRANADMIRTSGNEDIVCLQDHDDNSAKDDLPLSIASFRPSPHQARCAHAFFAFFKASNSQILFG